MQNMLMGVSVHTLPSNVGVSFVPRASGPEAAAPKGPRAVRAATRQQTRTDALWTSPTHFLLIPIPPAAMITSLSTSF